MPTSERQRFLTEDEVVAATVRYLKQHRYTIVSYAKSSERGKDIVAEKSGSELWVEAKGDTSGRPRSPRYGKQFNRNQAFDHCAKAVYVAMNYAQQKVAGRSVQAAIALPDNDINHERIDPIAKSLKRLKIWVFWVSANGDVVQGG